MPKRKQDPYRSYDIDDWKWEFLRRNSRYKKKYRAIEWLKRRLSKSSSGSKGSFRAFGLRCSFSYVLRSKGGDEWHFDHSAIYRKKGIEQRSGDQYTFLDIPSPDAPSTEYKKKVLRKTDAVSEISDIRGEEPWEVWTPSELQEHEIAVQIDTRYSEKEILSQLKRVLKTYRPKQRNQIKKYKDYFAVWVLRKGGRTADEIAPELWPKEYEKIGGRNPDTAEKGALIQRVYDYEKAVQKLIDQSFPPKSRPPKIQK